MTLMANLWRSYVASVANIISKHQITNGGNVILWQPENEYSGAAPGFTFPDPAYMQYLEDQACNAGIVVPFINNDAWTHGYQAPGTGKGAVDIYASICNNNSRLLFAFEEAYILAGL